MPENGTDDDDDDDDDEDDELVGALSPLNHISGLTTNLGLSPIVIQKGKCKSFSVKSFEQLFKNTSRKHYLNTLHIL